MVAEMLDNARMTIASRGHQHPVRHLPAIVEDRIPRERGHVTIRFLHDQIGRGKVPVAALAAGKSSFQATMCDPAQPERQRPDSGVKHRVAGRGVEPFDQVRGQRAELQQLIASVRSAMYAAKSLSDVDRNISDLNRS